MKKDIIFRYSLLNEIFHIHLPTTHIPNKLHCTNSLRLGITLSISHSISSDIQQSRIQLEQAKWLRLDWDTDLARHDCICKTATRNRRPRSLRPRSLALGYAWSGVTTVSSSIDGVADATNDLTTTASFLGGRGRGGILHVGISKIIVITAKAV